MPVRASVRPRVADAAPTAAGFVVAAAAPDATTEPGAPNDVRSWAPMTADRLTSVPSTFVEAPDGEDSDGAAPDSVVPAADVACVPATAPLPPLPGPFVGRAGLAWAGADSSPQLIQNTLCLPAPGAPSCVAVSFTWKPCFLGVRPVNRELRL